MPYLLNGGPVGYPCVVDEGTVLRNPAFDGGYTIAPEYELEFPERWVAILPWIISVHGTQPPQNSASRAHCGTPLRMICS